MVNKSIMGSLRLPVVIFAGLTTFLASTCNLSFAIPIIDLDTQSGFIGTNDNDTLVGLGLFNVSAEAIALGVDITLFGSGKFDNFVLADAQAHGVDALPGQDLVFISDLLTTTATAMVTGAAADVSLTGDASADISVNAMAESTGVDGGDDDDTITNVSAVSSNAAADATAVETVLTIDGGLISSADAGDALVEAGTRSDANATAITGGSGADQINNIANLGASAVASTTSVTAGLSVAIGANANVSTGAALSDGSSVSTALVTGIDAGDGNDTVNNNGEVVLDSSASATGVAFSLDVGGSLSGDVATGESMINSRTQADSLGIGIAAGGGSDSILSSGPIGIASESTATAVSGSLSVSVGQEGNVVSGGGVSDLSTRATSQATAIDAGDGDDTIIALSTASSGIDLSADADATGVAVTLDITGSVEGSVAGGAALSNARTDAEAHATGLSAGGGNDQITNATGINATTTATATAVSAGLSVGVSIDGDVTSGAAVSDASSLAVTQATGIDGGEGDDTIYSVAAGDDVIALSATSNANGVAASFSVAGSVKGDASVGDALSEARTDADAAATGIAGGIGSDIVTSTTGIDASSAANATAVSGTFSVGVTVDGDVTAGAAVSDASSLASTRSIGIDGGAGDDTIISTTAGDFAITTTADSEANGVAASFTVAGSVSGAANAGDALSEARTDASAAATGIAGDDGMDTVLSDTGIAATAESTATAVAAGFSVAVGNEGDVTSGAAVSDASSLATTRAVGIDGGADGDTIGGEDGITGGITASADSTAVGVAASFSVAGSAEGTAQAGDALSEARTDADAEATGIAGGSGGDVIKSATGIDADAIADATAVSASFLVGITKEGEVTNPDASVSGIAASDASSLAASRAVGIDGGVGDDAITSVAVGDDIIDLFAKSTATGVSASFSVGGSVEGGAASGDALSEARTDADAQVTGIAGGDGVDTVLSNTSINAIAESTATAVSAGFSVAISKEGDVTAGAAVSDASSLATTRAVGIDGGADGDTIGGEDGITGGVTVRADSMATGVSASFSVAGSAEGDAASGAALSETRSDAIASATGIAGGGGDDIIRSATGIDSDAVSTTVAVGVGISAEITKSGDSEGTVTGASALSDASSLAVARSTGIDGGAGVDEIVSAAVEGNVIDVYAESTSTSVAVSVVVSGRMEGGIAGGGAISEASTTADAQAVGIDSGDDGGSIDNQTAIDAATVASSTAIGAGVDVGITGDGSVESAALSNASSRAAATSTGIAAGDGIDNITNSGELSALADSSATGVAASVTVAGTADGNVATQTVSDATVVAESRATGIDGGDGDDTIDNDGGIRLMDANEGTDTEADAKATSVAVSLEVSGSLNGDVTGDALSNASATASASATGIDGGSGIDDIDNSGRITSDIGAKTTSVGVTIDVGVTADGDASGAALSDASATAIAQAYGIDGGDGIDDIDNLGELDLRARSDAVGISAAVTVAGTMDGNASSRAVSDASVTAESDVTGISGGAGGDTITNAGIIRLMDNGEADAVATAVAVSLNVSGSLDGNVDGQALSDSSATANASAVGIDGGAGTDTIDNQADISADVGADVLGLAVTLDVGFTLDGDATGAALSDTSAEAVATASGIDGGDDGDDIDNLANIDISTDAESEAYAVSVSITGSLGGIAEGNAASDASATSIAQSTGIGGGAGDDDIDTTAEDVAADDFTIRTAAASDASASAVTVQATAAIGAANGAAIADASATSESISTGIGGGTGDDDINNLSAIDATADANATANSTTVTANLALGSGDSVATGNSGSTASATATGIDGGAGIDTIINAASIFAGATEGSPMAEARAGSTTVSVGITIGEADNAASANASALAEANAAAIAGGSGGDRIENTGTLMAGSATEPDELTGPLALALASSETITVGITLGDAGSEATSDSSSTAVSDITGIEGGAGGDVIENSGTINTFSSAEALGQSATTTVSLTLGSSEGKSTADAASRSIALGAGIDGGADADTITTDGTVTVDVRSEARTLSSGLNLELISIGASDQSAEANASATADAVARGVYGGAGSDTITAAGDFSVRADSFVDSRAVANTSGGFSVGDSVKQAQSRAETTARSLAVGIDGGAGDDDIVDAAVLNIESVANATARGVSSSNSGLNLAGSSTGESMSDARTIVSAEGVGIRGGEEEPGSVETDSDTITATAPLTVTAEATGSAQSTSETDVVAIFGSADGSAAADASALVLARAVGIDGGADSDGITTSENEENETTGDIDVSATASADVTSRSTATGTVGFGDASTMGVSDASVSIAAEAVGIDGGSGDDEINANHRVSVASETSGDVTSTSLATADVAFGSASSGTVSDASVDVQAAATGVDGGLGADDIFIGSLFDVSATSDGTVVSNSQSDADSVFGSASSSSISDASASRRVSTVGVDGGAGADEIEVAVAAELLAQSRSTGSVETLSYANADAGLFGDASAGTATAASSEGAASAAGIIGGDDDDTIRNFGSLSADADATLTITSTAVSIADSTFGDAFAGAASDTAIAGRATASGITGDGGADEIETQGNLSVNAAAVTDVQQVTVALADSTFGDGDTVADSRNSSSGAVAVVGIDGGDGDDTITAGGQIAIAGASDVTVNNLTVSGSGDASSDAQTLAIADVSGIDGGDGDDEISGTGEILVAAAPHVGVANRTYGGGGNVAGNVGIELQADVSGIAAGTGEDTITIGDDGNLLVVVGRQRDSTATIAESESGNVLIDTSLIEEPSENVEGKWLRIDPDDAPAFFTRVESFDPATGEMTLRDPIPVDLAADTSYTVFDVDPDGADIEVSTVDIGGRVEVDAATQGNVMASGVSGGAGDDAITNNGNVAVKASNFTKAGSRTVSGNIQSDLSTRSNVFGIGIDGDALDLDVAGGADVLMNFGDVSVEAASSIDFGASQLSYFGQSSIDAAGEAQATAIGLRGGEMSDIVVHSGNLYITSEASILAEEKSETVFGDIEQQLDFAASGESVGVSAGDGDDVVMSSGSVEVSGSAKASVIGSTTTESFFNIFLGIYEARTENIVDVSLDGRGRGLDLGAGADVVESTGDLTVLALAVPVGVDEYVALAISEGNETGARATAVNTAVATGIGGDSGKHWVTTSSAIDVEARSVATSSATAEKVLAADDQSTITSIEQQYQFKDDALAGTDLDFTDKELRLTSSDDGFTRLESSVTAVDSDLAANQFEDSAAMNANFDSVVGTRIRFESDDPDVATFESVVVGFEVVVDNGGNTAVFTLEDPLPTLLAVDDAYRLSVLTATVTEFDAASGTFTLGEVVPDVATNEVYTLSVVSSTETMVPGSFTFVDATRSNEDQDDFVGSWVSFPNAPAGFAARVDGFDSQTGRFTLTCVESCDESFEVVAGDIYELSLTRDGTSGSDAAANAYGIDLRGGDARITNSGEILVTATAEASTEVNVRFGADNASADATAVAYGIRTGNGNDTITNEEAATISVVTEAMSETNTGEQSSSATATGIETGTGDDVVTNNGLVSALVYTNGVATSDTGIDLGAGDDALILGADSEVIGTITLGDDNDSLTLVGTPIVRDASGASIDPQAGAGIDSLVLQGAGAFAGAPDGFERATKAGTGTYALSGLAPLDSLTIEEGVLELGSDYDFAADGEFSTYIHSDGDEGRLLVDGSATLDGAIDIEKRGGYISDDSRYSVVETTGSVSGMFNDVTLPASTPLLRFDLEQTINSVDAVATAESFSLVAGNPLYRQIALNLDSLADDASGDMAFVLGTLQSLESDFDQAFASASPDSHLVTTQTTVATGQQVTRLLQNHLASSRAVYRQSIQGQAAYGNVSFAYNNGIGAIGLSSTPIVAGHQDPRFMLAANEYSDTGVSQTPPQQTDIWGGKFTLSDTGVSQTLPQQTKAKSQAWIQGAKAYGDYDEVDGYTDFDTDSSIVALGYDFRLSERLIVGGTLGYAKTDLDMGTTRADGQIEAWSGGAYATWFNDKAYLEGGISYANQSFDNQRSVVIGSITRRATSNHDGTVWLGFLGGGYQFGSNSWSFEPYGSLYYFNVEEDGFTETGAASLNQIIEGRNTEALIGELGAKAARLQKLGKGMLDLHASLGLNHDFDIDDARISYSYAGAAGDVFVIDDRDLERNSAVFGAGISYTSGNSSISLDYRRLQNNDFNNDSIFAGLESRF